MCILHLQKNNSDSFLISWSCQRNKTQKLSSTVNNFISPLNSCVPPVNCGTVSLVSVGCLPPKSKASLLSSTVQICCHTWHSATQMLFQGKHCNVQHGLFCNSPGLKEYGVVYWGLWIVQQIVFFKSTSTGSSITTCFYVRAAAISSFCPWWIPHLREFPWGDRLSAQWKEYIPPSPRESGTQQPSHARFLSVFPSGDKLEGWFSWLDPCLSSVHFPH